MIKKRMVAMLLAGGQGTRLGVLTNRTAKPAVPFGGKYRIIDFPLSNCVNSGVDTVGVLTQYEPLELNGYLGNGSAWDLDRNSGGVYVLPPYVKGSRGEWYSGTANAICRPSTISARTSSPQCCRMAGACLPTALTVTGRMSAPCRAFGKPTWSSSRMNRS